MSVIRGLRKALVVATAVAGLGVAAPAAQADTTHAGEPPTAASHPCGFHTVTASPSQAHYKHCTSEPYAVRVTVQHYFSGDTEVCVQPNADAFLGYTFDVSYAYYNGGLC